MDHDDSKRPDDEALLPDPMREIEQMIGRFTAPTAASPDLPASSESEANLDTPQPSPPAEELSDLFAFADAPTPGHGAESHGAESHGAESHGAEPSDTTPPPTPESTTSSAVPRGIEEPEGVEASGEADFDPLEAPTLSLDEILESRVVEAEAEDPASEDLPGVVPAGLGPVDTVAGDTVPGDDNSEPVPQGPNLDELVARLDAAAAAPADLPSAATPRVDGRRLERAVVFGIGGTRYALAMGQVTEVGPVPSITPLPRVPDWLLGVTNLRGDVLAVLDLRRFLGQPTLEASDRHRMLVLHAEGGRRAAGVVVDRVYGASSIDPETVHRPTAPVDDPVHSYLRGVTERDERLLAILDAEKLLRASVLQPFAA